MPIDKRKWFDVPDSLVTREDGDAEYCNVEARFQDHYVLNPEKTKIQRANVYDIGIVFQSRVKRASGDIPAQKNMSAQVLRFDKGPDKSRPRTVSGPTGLVVIREGPTGMSKDDFSAAMKAIRRCPDGWAHYQQFRRSPVTPLETKALDQINSVEETPRGVLVDRGEGELVREEIDDEDREEEEGLPQVVERPKKKKPLKRIG